MYFQTKPRNVVLGKNDISCDCQMWIKLATPNTWKTSLQEGSQDLRTWKLQRKTVFRQHHLEGMEIKDSGKGLSNQRQHKGLTRQTKQIKTTINCE